MTTVYDSYYDYCCFESPTDIGDADAEVAQTGDVSSPVVFVYQPQSHATPVRDRRSNRRQQRRQRAGCFTEIIWDDVQRAKDLLRMSRRRRRQEHHLGGGEEVGSGSNGGSQAVTATPALRSLKRRCRTSSHQTPSLGGDSANISMGAGTAAVSSEASSQLHQPAAASRLRDLSRQLLRGLAAAGEKQRQADGAIVQQCTEAGKHLWNASSRDSMTGRLCLTTQYPIELELDDASLDAELRQLQDEAAVQAALVEANARLLQEQKKSSSLGGVGLLAGRHAKRRCTMEFVKSQDKLRVLNMRIAEIRTRDLPAAAAAGEDQQRAVQSSAGSPRVVQAASDLSQSLLSLAASSDVSPVESRVQGFMQLKKSASLTSSTSTGSSNSSSSCRGGASRQQPSSAVSHAGSLDSGFQEIVPVADIAAFDGLLAYDFQLIDQDDIDE